MAIYLHILTGPYRVVHRNESVLKSIFKRGYEEIRDRKFLGILKKDRTWLKYELHCNVKTSAPLFFQNNLTFVNQMLGESGVISTTREIRPVDCLSLININ